MLACYMLYAIYYKCDIFAIYTSYAIDAIYAIPPLHPSSGPWSASNNIESESLGFATFPSLSLEKVRKANMWDFTFFATNFTFYCVSIVFVTRFAMSYISSRIHSCIHSCIHISSQLKILTIKLLFYTFQYAMDLNCGHCFENSISKSERRDPKILLGTQVS